MGSPMTMGGGQMASWNPNDNSQPMFPDNSFQEPGMQLRSMGLKVHYTFDKDGKVNCLARYPQTLQVQTIPIDDANTIGVLDLRICIQAVIECSPELASGDGDYTIYALDYSEPDTPLVGQGMLSWALETLGNDMASREPKMVTGRVTKNLLAVFGGGNRETLEVKLKLTSAAKVQRPDGSRGMDSQQGRPVESATTPSAMTPTGAAEWNNFIHHNPQIGQPAQPPRGTSPALSHVSHGPPPMVHRDSFSQPPQQGMPSQQPQRIAPIPVDPQSAPAAPNASSRPSSRTSNRPPRKKQPTGRPRGRPRKRPIEGNTSGYEDGTEGEDGPTAKKRVTTTKVDKATSNPFGSGQESLRVAASTSGSLRTIRPVGSSQEVAGAGSHLQEVPRAPTPVPEGPFLGRPGRAPSTSKARRGSAMSQELAPSYPSQYVESRMAPLPGPDDSRSPESAVPTPTYSEDSPADIGSSPPVTRNTPFIRSSPPASSPILPPMPQPQLPHDLSLTNTEMDEFFADEALQAALRETLPSYNLPRNPVEATESSGVPIQVFQMQDGPDGQDLVHIRNYNTPHPTSTPAGPDGQSMTNMRNFNAPHPTSTPADPAENASLPPLPPPPPPKEAPAKPKARRPAATKKNSRNTTSPPALAPTPPPTTDAVERPNSPMAPPQPPQTTEPTDANKDTESKPKNGEGPTGESAQEAPPAVEPPVNAGGKQNKSRPKKNPCQLSRSQSAGPMMLPAVPASEPTGPSSLSQSTTAEPSSEKVTVPATLKRSASIGPMIGPRSSENLAAPGSRLSPKPPANAAESSAPLVPASYSGITSATSPPSGLVLPQPVCPPSDALPLPPSSPGESRMNKNVVKRNAIKQRLEDAILKGEMPPFCNNCGAIETPTWRKIWVQDHKGAPGPMEFSEKPGKVTAVEVMERDAEEKPSSYRLIKKSLGPDDDAAAWRELLLCNPCGIWLAKCKCHRPQDRWQKDASRLGQERRKRSSTGGGNPRLKKSKTKDGSQINLTSEACPPTDALGSIEPSSPKPTESASQQLDTDRPESEQRDSEAGETSTGRDQSEAVRSGSKDSQSNGTAKSPIDTKLDSALGSTKRILFPSPRKEGVAMALGELSVNIVQTADESRRLKEPPHGKENVEHAVEDETTITFDDLEHLFQSPAVARPRTPPPKTKSAAPATPFKTPTRQTPSHRPITRSVTKSMRSNKSLESPIRFDLESPTRSAQSRIGSARRRRSPRNHDSELMDSLPATISRYHEGSVSPITREIIGMIGKPEQPTPRSGVKPRQDILTEQEMENMGWYNMFRSPERNAALQKSLDTEREAGGSTESWYTGSMDSWEEWMKEHGSDLGSFEK